MSNFGKRGGGGRRKNPRVAAPLAVLVVTLTCAQTAVLLDISFSGARIRGNGIPNRGEELFLKIDSIEAFGTVAWSEGDEHGIHFDAPLSPRQLALLQRQGVFKSLSGLNPEQQMALEDWTTGLAR